MFERSNRFLRVRFWMLLSVLSVLLLPLLSQNCRWFLIGLWRTLSRSEGLGKYGGLDSG